MKEVIVSIIIPTFNVEKYIKKCINSVLEQTYKSFEIILVDDCSTDRTLEIISSYSDPRIKVFINKENKGPSYSRNRAIEKAKGDWIAFLDGDDWWDSNRLEILIKVANDSSADMISDDIFFTYSENQRPWGSEFQYKKIGEENVINLTPELLINNDLGIQPMIKREILQENKISFDERIKYGEDFKLYLECLVNVKKAVILKEPYYFYRMREGSLMTTQKKQLLTQTINEINALLKKSVFIEDTNIKAALLGRKKRLINSLLYYEFIELTLHKKEYFKAIKLILLKPKLFFLIFYRIPRVVRYRLLRRLKISSLKERRTTDV